MGYWLARDIAVGFPLQNWMVVALVMILIWAVFQWCSRR
jgi:hypothetical protein